MARMPIAAVFLLSLGLLFPQTASAGDCCSDGLTCGDGCTDGCGEGVFSSCLSGGALSWLHKSDHCLSEFISPMTNPVFFEDPRTLTEARFIYMNHGIPQSLGGHQVQLLAMQVRAALTDNLSIIATKDGFVMSNNGLVHDGWADVAAGLKLNVFKDYQSQTVVSIGGTYEMPVGSPRALQGNGDGEFHLFATGGTEILDNTHWISGSGFRLPVDGSAESTVWYWSNHLDRKLGNSNLYLLTECNWYHWMSGGNTPIPVDGLDLINLGSNSVANQDVVTGALGVKYKPTINTEIGFAWEVPLTSQRDILKDRFTIDWILRY
ncbi:MAG: hypothetical protein R3C49_03010 [Planctomycetaceae bacterium]